MRRVPQIAPIVDFERRDPLAGEDLGLLQGFVDELDATRRRIQRDEARGRGDPQPISPPRHVEHPVQVRVGRSLRPYRHEDVAAGVESTDPEIRVPVSDPERTVRRLDDAGQPLLRRRAAETRTLVRSQTLRTRSAGVQSIAAADPHGSITTFRHGGDRIGGLEVQQGRLQIEAKHPPRPELRRIAGQPEDVIARDRERCNRPDSSGFGSDVDLAQGRGPGIEREEAAVQRPDPETALRVLDDRHEVIAPRALDVLESVSTRIVPIEPATDRRDPEAPFRVLVQIHHVAVRQAGGIGGIVHVAHEAVLVGRPAVQPRPGSDPQIATGILEDGPDPVVAEARRIARIMSESDEARP